MPGLGLGIGGLRSRNRRAGTGGFTITASLAPASSVLFPGQALQETSGWSGFLSPGNYASTAPGETIADVTVLYTGDTPDAVTPLADGDINSFSISVTGTAGTTRVFSAAPRVVTYAAPTVQTALVTRSFNEGTGVQTVNMSAAFAGAGLSYDMPSLTGVSIAAASGVVTIDTAVADVQAGTVLTVTAQNSGGSATAELDLTINAVDLTLAGLTGGIALIGSEAAITGVLSDGSGITDYAWGSSLNGTEFGTGSNPGALGPADGGTLYLTAISGGKAFRVTAPITYPAPLAAGGLVAQSVERGSGLVSYDTSVDFTGSDLTFSVNAVPGVSIGSATGVVRFDTDVMAEQIGTVLTVTALNSGGTAQSSFAVDVTEAIVYSSAITGLITNPTHGLTAQIGTAVTGVVSNLQGGEAVVHRWRDGSGLISGADVSTYTPVAGQDLQTLRYAPTVDGEEVLSAGHTVRYAPPVAGSLAPVDEILGSGTIVVNVAAGFTGADLTYAENVSWASLAGSSLSINDALRNATLPVTATNSGGSATVDLSVTISAPVVTVSNPIADQSFEQNSGDVTLDLRTVFENADGYSVTGAGALIEADGFTLRLQDDPPRNGVSITVTGSNAFNSAQDVFLLTVSAAPTAPEQMTAPALVVNGASQITATLAADPGNGGSAITARDLRYSTDQSNWTVLVDVVSPQVITGLTAGTEYFVQTRARNAIGAGAWSVSGTATTPAGGPVSYTFENNANGNVTFVNAGASPTPAFQDNEDGTVERTA